MSKYAYAALLSAAVSLVASTSVQAQEAALTPGGDVTAEAATPLPPVVVEAPSKPIARRAPKKKSNIGSSVATAPASADVGEVSGEGVAGVTVGVYTLGQLDMIGGSAITNEAMWTFNKNSLGEAVSILPGVSWLPSGAPTINSSGARNEGDIFVRGFNRFQVPLSIDGVRVYLPADNRIDMNRFLTPDLAEVQVAKGYVSVLNGPGGMGGAINLVSRKPTKEVELEGRVGAVFDGDLASMGQWNAYAFGGTRQKGYYAQVSGTIIDQDHFDMSGDFSPSPYSVPGSPGNVADFPYENGGNRDRSGFEDWRINAKVGITPNATDEYSINYTVQQSSKEAPLHVDRQVVQGYFFGSYPRFWDWPQWDLSTLSWMSKTQIGDASYVKTNAYYNTFENMISFYPNSSYTSPFLDSPYDDSSYGGFVEFGTKLIPMNTLKAAIHYRHDQHDSWDIDYRVDPDNSGPPNPQLKPDPTISPKTRKAEEVWSFALENTFRATRDVDVVTGVSYDRNKVLIAEDKPGLPELFKPEVDAWNWQGAVIYRYNDAGQMHASISSRTRFPTLFDRYSTRFGSRNSNPTLEPERAINYELGFSETFWQSVKVSSAVFYSDLKDSINNAWAGPNGDASIVGFNADGESYGFEGSVEWQATRNLRIGGNYTYIERNLDFAQAALGVPIGGTEPPNAREAVAASQVEGIPRHEAFIYLSWNPTRQLTLTPSLHVASDRTALVTSCDSTLPFVNANPQNSGLCPASGLAPNQGARRPNYVDLGAFALLNFQAEYEFTQNFTTAVGVTNLLDQDYSLAQGFPQPGRQFYLTARAKF